METGSGSDAEPLFSDNEDGDEEWRAPLSLDSDATSSRATGSSHVGSSPLPEATTTAAAAAAAAVSDETGLRMSLNAHKAGMDGVDQVKANAIILKASKGSRFYVNEQRRNEQTAVRIQAMLAKLKS
jgi:uncharacterized secreted protein with C-terminal beta-propeller domain